MNRSLTKTLYVRVPADLAKWIAAEAKRRSTKTVKLTSSDVVRDILAAASASRPS